MKRAVTIFSVIAALSHGPAHPAAQSEVDGRRSVRLVKQFVSAQQEFNVQRLDELMSEDYVEVSPLGDVDHRDQVIGFYRGAGPLQKLAISLAIIEVLAQGRAELVIATVTFASQGTEAEQRRSLQVSYLVRLDEDRQKIAFVQYTPRQVPTR